MTLPYLRAIRPAAQAGPVAGQGELASIGFTTRHLPRTTRRTPDHVHARPIRRQAPTRSPLPQALDRVDRSDSHGDDVLGGVMVGGWLFGTFFCG